MDDLEKTKNFTAEDIPGVPAARRRLCGACAHRKGSRLEDDICWALALRPRVQSRESASRPTGSWEGSLFGLHVLSQSVWHNPMGDPTVGAFLGLLASKVGDCLNGKRICTNSGHTNPWSSILTSPTKVHFFGFLLLLLLLWGCVKIFAYFHSAQEPEQWKMRHL